MNVKRSSPVIKILGLSTGAEADWWRHTFNWWTWLIKLENILTCFIRSCWSAMVLKYNSCNELPQVHSGYFHPRMFYNWREMRLPTLYTHCTVFCFDSCRRSAVVLSLVRKYFWHAGEDGNADHKTDVNVYVGDELFIFTNGHSQKVGAWLCIQLRYFSTIRAAVSALEILWFFRQEWGFQRALRKAHTCPLLTKKEDKGFEEKEK